MNFAFFIIKFFFSQALYVFMCVCAYICVCMYMCVCVYVCICVCVIVVIEQLYYCIKVRTGESSSVARDHQRCLNCVSWRTR